MLAACQQPAPSVGPGGAPPATSGQQPAVERARFTKVTYADLPGWADDAHEQAFAAFLQSCAALARAPAGTAKLLNDAREACAATSGVAPGDRAAARAFFERWFQPYRATSPSGRDGLFTGYFEALLRGARQGSARYPVPLYIRPPDLAREDDPARGIRMVGRMENGVLKPYATRAEIDAGALQGRHLELAWVDSAIDAFVLHVQGSGRVVLDNGSELRVGVDGTNGWPYTSIGAVLVERGALLREDVTLQSIRAWLAANPGEARAVMQRNARYVFFRELRGPGPLGALGVPVTPGRSLAVDPRSVPLGFPLWLDTTDPRDGPPLRRLVMAQDVGAAIQGAVRGDLFWGAGPQAEDAAGRMRSRGGYFLLYPHAAAPGS